MIRSVIGHRGPREFTPEEGNQMHYQTEEENQTDKKDILAQTLQYRPENYKIPSFAKED